MKNIKEGNIYNVETSKSSPDRSKELTDVNKIMMDQFWSAMSRQNINPAVAKQIAKQTFNYQSDSK
jgi:hypothetical protein